LYLFFIALTLSAILKKGEKMMTYLIECPYCHKDNELNLCFDTCQDSFDMLCLHCEKFFEVEYSPVFYTSEINIDTCEECGEQIRNAKKRNECFPYPDINNRNILCTKCYMKLLNKKFKEMLKNN
jgi:hypothetical protein